ncbi:sidekick-1-like 2, partial [Homarus americanus]
MSWARLMLQQLEINFYSRRTLVLATIKRGDGFQQMLERISPLKLYTVCPKNYAHNSDLQLSAGADYIKASWLKEFKATSYSINWTPKDHGGTYTMDGGNNISYTITDLQPCTDYTVTVQPMKNSSKEGLPLTATTTTTIADPDPKLKVVTVKSQSSTQLFVNWTAAQGVGNCCVTYLITWGPASKAHGGGSATTTSLNYSITQLDTWTIYHVCVAAQTRTDYNKDTCADGRTDEDAPGPPVITSVVSSSFSSIRVSWSSPENPNGIITKYNVSWTWEGNKDHDITNDTTTSCTITDLTPCTNYSVTVTATTSKGYGPESKAATGTTHSKDPDPVTGVNVNNYTDNSTLLDVSWSEVQDVGNCDVTYKITWSPASNGDGSNTTTTTSLSYIITQLEAWTTYH